MHDVRTFRWSVGWSLDVSGITNCVWCAAGLRRSPDRRTASAAARSKTAGERRQAPQQHLLGAGQRLGQAGRRSSASHCAPGRLVRPVRTSAAHGTRPRARRPRAGPAAARRTAGPRRGQPGRCRPTQTATSGRQLEQTDRSTNWRRAGDVELHIYGGRRRPRPVIQVKARRLRSMAITSPGSWKPGPRWAASGASPNSGRTNPSCRPGRTAIRVLSGEGTPRGTSRQAGLIRAGAFSQWG